MEQHAKLESPLERAQGYRLDHVEGRFAIDTHLHGAPWQVIVEPDEDQQLLVVVTAYSVT